MTYPLLAAGFLVAALVAAVLLARRARLRPAQRIGMLAAAGVLLALTVVFDSVMIGLGLFTYAPERISGIQVGLAPVEDLAYPLALVVVLPVLWTLLTRPGGVPAGALLGHAWRASRPVSWINTAFPFAAAMLLTTREVDWLLVVGTLYYLVPYNLAMYGINDVFDYASDIGNPRKGGIEGALVPPRFHRPLLGLAAAANAPFLIVLLAAGGPWAWLVIGVSTFAVIAYSAPGLRFKERPVLDSVTSSVHFVSPAVVGLTLAGAAVDVGVVALLGAFLIWGMAAHAFGAVQDIGPDRAAGIASIATALGAGRTVRLAMLLWLIAGLLPLAAPFPASLAGIVVVPYLLNVMPYVRVTDPEAAGTNRAWRRFIGLNYLAGSIVTLVMIAYWRLSS